MGIAITIMNGAADGKIFEFRKTPIVLGRHPNDDVYFPHNNKVSRHHATINQEDNCYFIEDTGPQGQGSTNGTFVDGNRITCKTSICSPCLILLGGVCVKFEVK